MADKRIKVLYVTGWQRSGSTIIGNLLGHVSGFFGVGELFYLWDRNLQWHEPCGCGTTLEHCDVWSQVIPLAFGGFDKIDLDRIVRARDAAARDRHIPLALLQGGRLHLNRNSRDLLTDLERLYRAIVDVTGCEVIVDTSKLPLYGALLSQSDKLDVYGVHLIRDPRAVAFSLQRRKIRPHLNEYMFRVGPLRSTVHWCMANLATERLWEHTPGRYMRVRYEDFAANPDTTLRRIIRMVATDRDLSSVLKGDEAILHENHLVSGNPNMFARGAVKIALDDEWAHAMSTIQRQTVELVAWPLMRRYGYADPASEAQTPRPSTPIASV